MATFERGSVRIRYDEAGSGFPLLAPMSWMQRLRRVFDIDIARCPRCGGGGLRLVAVITDPRVIGAILEHIDTQEARAPPSPSS